MDSDVSVEGSRRSAIIQAALELFALRGTAETTLQTIADAAGVSVGLVQHHFTSKVGLIAAVEAHALEVIGAVMAQPMPQSPAESAPEIGRRVSRLFAEHVAALDFMGRQLVEGAASGVGLFDAMARMGIARWEQLAQAGAVHPDLDVVWAALNPLLLVFGAIVFRRQLEQHLAEPLTNPSQLRRWEDSVNILITQGQLRREYWP
ncbi:TetR/AcrR family transcriptional regulator [Mycolicibacterium rhodesiae]|uniref:TetR family transcriptional regulator n=1 Tax=Mycolicibacterium rhodesiae TaxID=36814 RepID=A0A1X0IJI7_MYCRH|nr:TetR/AcrR family transcriptional regulator [Mycolicibacterium rhodesiae]MCV7347566.1 TetR/AcrR family transcriptional regulator [Mycolicibacterium rhodesiae]ORB47998.1 TetR family transcriptional regulator [Mycolicibacterium rhodesiae]